MYRKFLFSMFAVVLTFLTGGAFAQLVLPAEMSAEGIANAGMATWAPNIAPVLGTIIAISIVLGLFRLFWSSGKSLGKGRG